MNPIPLRFTSDLHIVLLLRSHVYAKILSRGSLVVASDFIPAAVNGDLRILKPANDDQSI